MRSLLFISIGFFISSFSLLHAQLKVSGLELENYNYPFPVKFIKLKLQNEVYKMAYMNVPPAKALTDSEEKTVLLLHGKNFNGAYWKQTADSLSQAGYRVIIPDQLGFGKSSKPANFQYTFQQLAQNTKALLDSLNIHKIAVLGHSMGGMLAVRFTLMFPELVTRLILEDPIGLEDYKLKVPYQPVDQWYQRELKQDYAAMKKYQQASYYHGEWKPEYEPWLDITAGWTLNKNYASIAWNSALTYDMIMTQPIVYELERIEVPVLLIIGQKDKTALGKELVAKEVAETMGNYPELGKQTKHKLKNCELVELEGVGHIPHIESFAGFIQPLISFLKK